jgi:(2R)-sulfolactate sulfo-lyase subunit alpha
MQSNASLPSLLLLHPADNVFVARRDIDAGEIVVLEGCELTVSTSVQVGHKVARFALEPGAPVLKYGAPIGSTTQAIAPGEHIHLHNMKSDYLPTHTRQTLAPESR